MQRACAARASLSRQRTLEHAASTANFEHSGVVFRAQAARAFGEHIANHPGAMLHVIESDQAEIKHHYAIVETKIVAARSRNALDEAHHVVREISDCTADERRKTRNANWMIARGEAPQLLDGISGELNVASAGFEGAGAATCAEDFLRV